MIFKEVDTAEFNRRRKYLYWLSSCIFIAKDYYEIPPADMVYKLLEVVHDSVPDMYLPSFCEEFMDDLDYELSRVLDYVHLYESHGHVFLLEDGLDDHEDDNGLFNATVQEYIDCDYDFYIPDFSEIQEYCQHGYWPSREPWQRLHDWLKGFYLDEQSMSNMFSSMVNTAMSITDPDSPEFMEPPYSMDDVESDTDEKLQNIRIDLMFGNNVEDCLSNYPELTAGIRDDAAAELHAILEECMRVTPKSSNRGYTD